MKGRRVYVSEGDSIPADVQQGDYWHHNGEWWFDSPNGGIGRLALHQVTEHEDGTITATPSILVSFGPKSSKTWHGYLAHGEWREC